MNPTYLNLYVWVWQLVRFIESRYRDSLTGKDEWSAWSDQGIDLDAIRQNWADGSSGDASPSREGRIFGRVDWLGEQGPHSGHPDRSRKEE